VVLIERAAVLVAALGAAASEATSIRDGVFTPEQAGRGRAAYTGPCDRCHGYKLDGAADDPDMLPRTSCPSAACRRARARCQPIAKRSRAS
jgi:hypothetical protein